MRRIIRNILGTGLFSALSLMQMNAASTEWTKIYSNDFGDGESNFGSALPGGVIHEDLFFVEDYGDFSLGTAYSITKHTSSDNGWHPGGDHTYSDNPNKGYFMAVNPQNSTDRIKVYMHEVQGICSGVTFRFSTYLANLMLTSGDGMDPTLGIGIYKDPDAKILVSESAFKRVTLSKCSGSNPNSLDWEQLQLEFTVSDDTIDYAYFIVTVNEPQAKGFDFAVDDILLEVQHPAVTIEHMEEEFEYGEPAHLKATFENNNFFANMANVKYQWLFQKEGETEFKVVGTSNPYTIPSFDKEKHNGVYKVQIAENGDFTSKVCALETEITIHETKNLKKIHLCKDQKIEENGTILDGSILNNGDRVEGANNYTYVVEVITPNTKTGEDEYVCIGFPASNGKTYDVEQEIEMNDTIFSEEYGCPSVITYKKLIVTGPTTKQLADKYICQGTSYNNKLYNELGTSPVKTSDGCIEFLQNVIVLPTYTDKELVVNIREGGEYNGTPYPRSGQYTDVLKLKTYPVSDCQCDSIVKVTINVNQKIIVNLPDETICEGDVFTFGNTTYSAPGTYNLSTTTDSKVLDCDSVTNLKLVINPRYSNENKPRDTTICYGSQLFGKIYNEPTVEPIRIKTEHKSVVTGCDSIVYYDVNVLKLQLSLAVKADRNTVCRGEEIEIKVTSLEPENTPLDWPLGLVGSSQGSIFTPEKDMVCVVKAARTVSTTETCETTDTVYVYVRDSPILTIDSVDQRENLVTYNVEGGALPYSIVLDKKEIGSDGVGEIRDSYIGMHTLTAIDSNKCASSQRYTITPVPITPSGYLSPNGDGVNDRWTIENIDVYSHARVRIYDRNGRMLMEYEGYDNEQGWDGRYNGHLMPATDYWYEINLPEVDTQYVGHFTLLYMQ